MIFGIVLRDSSERLPVPSTASRPFVEPEALVAVARKWYVVPGVRPVRLALTACAVVPVSVPDTGAVEP